MYNYKLLKLKSNLSNIKPSNHVRIFIVLIFFITTNVNIGFSQASKDFKFGFGFGMHYLGRPKDSAATLGLSIRVMAKYSLFSKKAIGIVPEFNAGYYFSINPVKGFNITPLINIRLFYENPEKSKFHILLGYGYNYYMVDPIALNDFNYLKFGLVCNEKGYGGFEASAIFQNMGGTILIGFNLCFGLSINDCREGNQDEGPKLPSSSKTKKQF